MKGYKFVRKYGDYSIGKTCAVDTFKGEELESLIASGTIKEVEIVEELESKIPEKLNMTIVKENFPDVYEKIMEKGKKEADAELQKQVEELTAKVTELEAQLKAE